MCSDESKRAAPEIRLAQTYASCIDQPCMGLFCFVSTVMSFVVMGADCTDTYANASSPTQPTYIRIDSTSVDWCRSRHGNEVDCSLVLPMLKTLQGHPEDGALWERSDMNKILAHARSIYRGTIDGNVILLYRQVFDITVACSDPNVALR
jgi:hypothetical protein